MPIYAYRCTACGHTQDVLQKISDPLLTRCPACGAEAYTKQVTAAGFQLKGSGWYVTDFRGDNKAAKASKEGGEAGSGGARATEPAASPSATESGNASDGGNGKTGAAPAPAAADKVEATKPAAAGGAPSGGDA